MPTNAATISRNTPDFGSRALAFLSAATLPGGLPCAIWDAAGKTRASAVVIFGGIALAEKQGESGRTALAVALVAKELAGLAHDPSLRASLLDLGGASIGILLEGGPAGISSILAKLGEVASHPAFLATGFPERDAQAALRSLRMGAEKRALEGHDSNDGGDYPLGDLEGLLRADLDGARSAWTAAFKPETLKVALVADANLLGPALLRQPANPAARPARTVSDLRAEAARAVYVELISAGTGNAASASWELGPTGVAVRAVAAGVAPKTAKGDLEKARARALERLFEESAATEVCRAMAVDLAGGGSGALPFLFASAIDSVDPADLAAAATSLGRPSP